MITIKIGKKKHRIIYSWELMTLQDFCNLASIPIPSGYESFIKADGSFTPETIDKYIEDMAAITDEQMNVEFPAYYRKVITCLTDIPESTPLTKEQIDNIYFYIKPFVVALIYHVPVVNFYGSLKEYSPDRLKNSFEIAGETYYLPESVQILDELIPLAKEQMITYCEAGDLFKGMRISREDVNRLALFMSIYCRKKGEEYTEALALERKDLMLQAPMSIVWAVFFCIVTRLKGSTETIRLFGKYPRTMEENVSEARAYKSMAAGGLSMNAQDTAVMER